MYNFTTLKKIFCLSSKKKGISLNSIIFIKIYQFSYSGTEFYRCDIMLAIGLMIRFKYKY